MPSPIAAFLPWSERNGRFSPLRAAVFAGLLVPVAILAARVGLDDLGARPLTEAIHVSGDWAVRMLVASLVVTPLRHLSGRGALIGVRRMIGLSAFFWVALHVGLWFADLGFDGVKAVLEILMRPYLTIGATAVLGLSALAATSTDGMIRRLGGPAWKRLHGLVHPIAILAIVHVFLQSKLDLAQGAILVGVAFGGLAIRLLVDRRARLGPGSVALATGVALVAGAGAEAIAFAARTGRNVEGLLLANGSFEARIAPSWIAAAIVAVASVSAWAARRRPSN